MLGFLAVTAAIASVIPQGETAAFYRAHFGSVMGTLVTAGGLDHAFTSWWFVGAEAWLAAALAACTWERARVAARRGPAGWGLTVLHVGLLLALAGLALLPFVTHEDYREIGEGDTAGFTKLSHPLTITVESFTADYYPNMEPRQFVTRAVVHRGEGEAGQKVLISVNHPFKLGVTRVYQFEWGWLLDGRVVPDGKPPLAFTMKDGAAVTPGNSPYRLEAYFIPDCVDEPGTAPYSRSPLPRNPRVLFALFRDGQPLKMGLVRPGETAAFPGGSLVFERYRRYTGLQAKEDPALPAALAGFALAALGLALYYGCRDHRIRTGNGPSGAFGGGDGKGQRAAIGPPEPGEGKKEGGNP